MKKLVFILALLLAACGTAPPQPVVPNVPLLPEKTQVVIPTGLTETCPPLKKLTQPSYTQGEAVTALKVWFDQYDLCAGRFAQFVSVVTPALNIKEVGPQNASGASAASAPVVQNPPVGQ
jgi:hypothetical protein